MSQLVVLNLGQGNCQEGFPVVIAQLWEVEKSTPIQFTGSLAPVPHLPEIYRQWRSLYESLYEQKNLRHTQEDDFEFDEGETNISENDFGTLCQDLKRELNSWLDSYFPDPKCDSFGKIERQLRAKLNPADEIRVIIETENHQLRQLPWHLWNFFKDYPKAELALSTQNFQRVSGSSYRDHFRVLGVIGNSEGLDVETDCQVMQMFPGAVTTLLMEPRRSTLTERLWEQQGWDILCFSGHSCTQNNGTMGRIEINPQESLAIADLKHALKAAIQQGLKLAIFNSCDGLGLAQELADLHIPQLIIMREPVPDHVAHQFLTDFLAAFSGGKSFYLAVREAKEKLQGLETDFPCASWLPVICQNPSTPSLTWPQPEALSTTPLNEPWWRKTLASVAQLCFPLWQFRWQLLQTSLLTTTMVVGVRTLGVLETYELQAFDHLMRSRPKELPDQRILLVQASPEDIKNQEVPSKSQASLSDDTLLKVFTKLKQYDPVVIGLDIYRDFEVDSDSPQLKTYFQQDNLYGICKVQGESDPQGVAPPPELSPDHITFSDTLHDPGKVVRRHLLSMRPPNPADPCTAGSHLSFLLALYYLDSQGIQWSYSANEEIQFENPETGKIIVLKELKSRIGGYQRLDAGGRQIFLNYHANPNPKKVVKTVSVQDLIQGIPERQLKDLKNRIVLIGIAGPINTSNDYWSTPYSYQQDIPGVVIQAHMVNQIVRAVLDDRPLLWTLSLWQETLWIWSWSLIGGIVVVYRLRAPFLLLSNSIALITLYGFCWLFILNGGWLPLVPAATSLGLTSISFIVFLYYHPYSSPSWKQEF